MRDATIMATHLNHQTILAVGQPRIHDKRLRNAHHLLSRHRSDGGQTLASRARSDR